MVIAVGAGTLAQRPVNRAPLLMGGYQVLAADFHVHTFPMNWTTLAPWDLVKEAQRQQLDVVAIIGHNDVWVSRFAEWFSQHFGGPTVLVGEEIVTHRFHIIGLGLHDTVSWDQPAASVIAAIHQQGGVAVAAHPVASYWPGYDEAAMRELDATEVLHPDAYGSPQKYSEMRAFYGRKKLTAIGSSDFHATGYPGLCRTYVFVRNRTQGELLEALREGRTVVYDRDRVAYGDPQLVRLAAQDGRLPLSIPGERPDGWLAILSRFTGALGLLIALFGAFVPR